MELRDRILAAAEKVIRANGLSKTTTKEIARIANCSEGSLYNHFQNKDDLVVRIIQMQMREYVVVLGTLSGSVGTRTVKDNLKDVLVAALDYFYLSIIATSNMFTEPNFLASHREEFRQRNFGPHRSNEILAAYLQAEQQQGRVKAGANARSIADLLLGACFQHAFHKHFLGADEPVEERVQFVEGILQTLVDSPLA